MKINQRHNPLFITLTLLGIMLFSSCGIFKFKKSCANQDVLSELPDDAANKMAKNEFDFEDLSIKAKATYETPTDKQSFTMSIRMKKDSAVWISVTGFGFEVMRFLVEPDSVYVLNKIAKSYEAYAIEDLRSFTQFDVNLQQLQQLLVGNSPFTPKSYKLYNGENKQLFRKESFIKSLLQLSESFRISENTLIQDGRADSLVISYAKFQNLKKEGCIPGTVKADYGSGKTKLSLQYNSVSTAKIDNLPFNVPTTYKKG